MDFNPSVRSPQDWTIQRPSGYLVYKQPRISAGEIHRRAEHVPLRRQSRLLPRNGWLGGRRPVDLLDVEPDTVADAARREAAERVF